jgi:hypothetical protein
MSEAAHITLAARRAGQGTQASSQPRLLRLGAEIRPMFAAPMRQRVRGHGASRESLPGVA